jgi:hypothetical protein
MSKNRTLTQFTTKIVPSRLQPGKCIFMLKKNEAGFEYLTQNDTDESSHVVSASGSTRSGKSTIIVHLMGDDGDKPSVASVTAKSQDVVDTDVNPFLDDSDVKHDTFV